MTAYSVFEALVVGAIVAACAIAMAGRLAPGMRAKLLAGAGTWMEKPGHPGWMQSIGQRWTAPSQAGGCGSGCGTCGTCGPSREAQPQIVEIRRTRS